MEQRYLRRKQAAAYIGFTPGSLAVIDSQGRGPRAIRIRGPRGCVRKVLYDVRDLDEWLDLQKDDAAT